MRGYSQLSRKNLKVILAAAAMIVTATVFQNCDQGFQASDSMRIRSNSATYVDADGNLIPIDTAGPLSISAIDSANVSGGNLNLDLVLNRSNGTAIQVAWQTVDGTAAAGANFFAVNGIATIPAGALGVTVKVPGIASDTAVALDFKVKINSVSGEASIARAEANARIPANSANPTYKIKSIVSAGSSYRTCAHYADNTIKCWGQSGAFGVSPNVGIALTPIAPMGLGPVKQVSVGPYTTCAVTMTDTVKCWGYVGQSGASSVNQPLPTEMFGLTGIKQVDVGYQNVCVLTNGGGVKCWGYGLPHLSTSANVSSDSPVDVPGLTANVKEIGFDGYTLAAHMSDDTIHVINRQSTTPVPVIALGKIKRMTFNNRAIYAFMADDTVRAIRATDLVISETPGLGPVKEIATGTSQTCAITMTNALKCWGNADMYGLNTSGTTTMALLSPTDVVAIPRARALGLGWYHTCILVNDEVKCLGNGNEVGNGSNENTLTFTKVIGL